jgi:hypothetical protein
MKLEVWIKGKAQAKQWTHSNPLTSESLLVVCWVKGRVKVRGFGAADGDPPWPLLEDIDLKTTSFH